MPSSRVADYFYSVLDQKPMQNFERVLDLTCYIELNLERFSVF